MHMQCCDITHDITALFNDITSKNKMMRFRRGTSEVGLTKKLSINGHRIGEPQPQYTQTAGCSMQCHTLPCLFGCILATRAYNHFIHPNFFLQVFATKLNYTSVFSAVVQPNLVESCAQRSSNTDSLACTSTAASIGDPGMCGVGHLGEWQSAPIIVA